MKYIHFFVSTFPFLFISLFGKSVYNPKLVNSKNGDHHDFPLGVLEATGRLIDGDKEILIMDVGEGGAAESAGLVVGDRIVLIDGKLPKPFQKKQTLDWMDHRHFWVQV